MRGKIKNNLDTIRVICALLVSSQRIILFNTPTHTNLGDHAITFGENKFFKDYFPYHKLILVPETLCTPKRLQLFEKFTDYKTLIAIQGGGHMGDLWPQHEVSIKRVLDVFVDNPKVVMPQTIYFEDGIIPQEYIRYYRRQKNMLFCAREESSYDAFQVLLGDTSRRICVPDIVLINEIGIHVKRNGIGICFRDDHEKVRRSSAVESIINAFAQNKDIPMEYITTVPEQPFKRNRVIIELNKIWSKIASKKLLITDRLHGMIFATITGTPCIALDNLSHKVSGVYKLIKYVPYICCIDSNSFSTELVEKYYRMNDNTYDASVVRRKYDELAKEIKNMMI